METLRYVVLANGLLAVVSLAFYVLLRHETFFGANRLALWLGLAGALGLPLLELTDWRPQPVRTVMQRTAQVIVPRVLPNSTLTQPEVTITFPNGQTFPAFESIRPQPFVWSWQYGLISLYVAGVLLLLIRLGAQLRKLITFIRQSAHEDYGDFTLVRNVGVSSPFSFFRWVVLNPDQHTVDELEQILRHERVHVRAGHSFDRIGAELVCIIFWFNPAAYLFRYLLGQTLEFSADRAVLAEGIDALAYQYHLVKVSLSAGSSTLTNHFSKSQLRFRIAMLNKPESAKTTWLKYPVLFIVTLTVATAFARPSVQTLKRFVPQPIAETIGRVTEPVTTRPLPTAEPTPSTDDALTVSANAGNGVSESETNNLAHPADSVNQLSKPDSVQKSPSRYIAYKGDYLYWLITPKTTLDEFAVMKQEFAKHGYQLQLNELKYDPFDAFIVRIVFKIQAPNGDVLHQNETHTDLKPIPIIAEYVSVKGTKGALAGSGRLENHYRKVIEQGVGRPPTLIETPPLTEKDFPNVLRQVAVDDEALTYQFIDDRKMEYLTLAGERKYNHLGIGFRKFNKEEIKKQSSSNSSIRVKADGSIGINEAQGEIIKAYINNEPATLDDIQRLKITQLHTVAVILGYDNTAQKRTMIDYLLFYVNADN